MSSAIRPELRADLPAGTILSAWPSRIGVFPSTPVERAMQDIGHMEAGLSAAEAGVDAVVIDSVADYGRDALRAALAIPVVGSGEAGLAAAAVHGRFAIVTVWPRSMNFAAESLLHIHGHAESCLGIRNVGHEDVLGMIADPDGYLSRVNRAEASILDQVVTEIDAAIAEGAEAIMLGCTCMSPMAAKVAVAVSVPVINPLAEAAKRAVVLARNGAAKGVATDRADLVRRMVDAIAGEADENCPVCVVAEAF
nr:aspartate/glutamate racemase family protein [Sphingomonas sp. CDS-1]